jgi:hypothetical protein
MSYLNCPACHLSLQASMDATNSVPAAFAVTASGSQCSPRRCLTASSPARYSTLPPVAPVNAGQACANEIEPQIAGVGSTEMSIRPRSQEARLQQCARSKLADRALG